MLDKGKTQPTNFCALSSHHFLHGTALSSPCLKQQSMRTLLFILCIFGLAACAPTPKAPTEKKSAPEPAAATVPTTPEESPSPLDYLKTAEGFKEWAYHIASTKWAESLKNMNYSLLVVSREGLGELEPGLLSSMKLPENKMAVEKLMGRHILVTPLYDDAGNLVNEVTTISGEKLKVDTEAGTVGGVAFSNDKFQTKTGRVIEIKMPVGLRVKDFVLKEGV